jgi:penicillin-insensitive murein endopeptidase
MVSGHGSHQSGLDADVWFNLDPKPKLTPWAREDVPLPSMVRDDQSWVDQRRFTDKQVTLLRLAANDPRVDRIFVHPTIKAALCERSHGDRSWLRKIRPWRGHDEHFHVRLSCPASSPDCAPQAPVPPGDGCDSTLDWWLDHPSPRPPATPVVHRGPSPRLPGQCRAVLGRR